MHLSYPTPLCCQDSAFSANALGLSKVGLRWTAPVLGVAQPEPPIISGSQVMSLGPPHQSHSVTLMAAPSPPQGALWLRIVQTPHGGAFFRGGCLGQAPPQPQIPPFRPPPFPFSRWPLWPGPPGPLMRCGFAPWVPTCSPGWSPCRLCLQGDGPGSREVIAAWRAAMAWAVLPLSRPGRFKGRGGPAAYPAPWGLAPSVPRWR